MVNLNFDTAYFFMIGFFVYGVKSVHWRNIAILALLTYKFYLSKIFSQVFQNVALLSSDHVFSDHMTLKNIKFFLSWKLTARGCLRASRKNTPTSGNSKLILKLSGTTHFRFLCIPMWLKRTLFQYRKWFQRDSKPNLLRL